MRRRWGRSSANTALWWMWPSLRWAVDTLLHLAEVWDVMSAVVRRQNTLVQCASCALYPP